MIQKDDTFQIGRIAKTHGLKGELVFNFTDDVFDRTECPYLICELDGILVPFFIESLRFRSEESALVKFEDIDSADKAQMLAGADVYFERKLVDELDDDEVPLDYFIGYTIIDTDGSVAGTITGIDDQTENWLFVVDHDGKEVLVPAHEEIITDMDHDKKTIEMNLPEGILDL